EAELDQIEQRCGGASKPPWQSFIEGRDHWGGDNFIRIGGMDDSEPDMYVSRATAEGLVPASDADLGFVAYARPGLPRLLAEVRRLRAAHEVPGDATATMVVSVRSREDLAEFVRQLHAEMLAGAKWENDDLASFLEAMSAWLKDSPGAYKNRGEPVPMHASWSFLAGALRGATYYE